jgi:anaerobic ribonucleoside-triphosphate reductase activating protein
VGDAMPEQTDVTAEPDVVNVAETCVGTKALGPGIRSVVWVQGCPLHCPGCIAPGWIPRRTARLVAPEELAAELLADPAVAGLTLSGGEPMLQAGALAAMVRAARAQRDVDVICFSGHTLAELRERPPSHGVPDLLEQVDVLIDGPYFAAANDGLGLRGSSNQQVHHLTGRLTHWDDGFVRRPRSAELRVRDRSVLLVGVPPPGLARGFDQAVRRVRQLAETHPLAGGHRLSEDRRPGSATEPTTGDES